MGNGKRKAFLFMDDSSIVKHRTFFVVYNGKCWNHERENTASDALERVQWKSIVRSITMQCRTCLEVDSTM